MQDLTEYLMLPELKSVPHPFPYQGSKRKLANAIIPLIPQGTPTIYEPFCGSAAISIAAKHTKRVDHAVIGDINGPLIELWKAILHNPRQLTDSYQEMWYAQQDDPKAYFNKVRDNFNREQRPDQLLYLLNRIVKGAVRYSRDGKFNQSADNRRLGAKPKVVMDRIYDVRQTIGEDTETIAGDYENIVANASPEDIIYMDPPYQGTSNNSDHRYVASLQRDNFEQALKRMNDKGLRFIVSYDVIDANESYGKALDDSLGLTHLHLIAGKSTQATFLGRDKLTVESLYLSPALISKLGGASNIPRLLNGSDDALFD